MDMFWGLIVLAMMGLLLASPVLAIASFNRMRRLEEQVRALERGRTFTPGQPLAPQMMDPGLIARVYALEQKLERIEALLSKIPGVAAADVAPPKPAAAPPPPPKPAAPVTPPPAGTMLTPPAPPPPRASSAVPPSVPKPIAPEPPRAQTPPAATDFDFEKLIAGRWLLWAGFVLVLVGVAYFLKYAFENNWIGPAGRVALGLVTGAGTLALSQPLLKRGYTYFSEIITALGGGMLYLSLYAAWNYYALVANSAAFLLMIVVTGALLAIAVGRDSQRLAVVGLIGGFLTPMLVSTGRNAQIELFSYIAALDIGLLVITRIRAWRWLEPLAFACTLIYFWGWYERFYDTAPQLLPTMIFAAVFFVIFAVLPAIRSQRTAEILPEQMTVMLVNAFAYLMALRAMLWPEHRWTLTIAVLALSAMHLGIMSLVPRREGETADGKGSFVFLLYAGLALTFATLAIPIRLEGKWITIAWAIEGAVLIWSGFRARLPMLRAAGFILFGITVVRLVFFAIPATEFLLNARFGVYAVTIACFTAALWFARENFDEVGEGERTAYGALAVALNMITLTAISQELWLYFSPSRYVVYTVQLEATRMLSLSAFWAIYASALFWAGMRWELGRLRLQAYMLLALAGAKVVLVDFAVSGGVSFAWPLLNARFVTFTIVLVAMLVFMRLAREKPEELGEPERNLMSWLGIACNLLAVAALSIEVWNYFQPPVGEPYHRETRLARQLGLSLLWTGYAAALMMAGVRRRAQGLRYQALALFGVTIVKVFFFDLGFLSGFYRIVSSLGLGVVLLVVAFLYQKFVTRTAAESAP